MTFEPFDADVEGNGNVPSASTDLRHDRRNPLLHFWLLGDEPAARPDDPSEVRMEGGGLL
jgi:hypothetical protein